MIATITDRFQSYLLSVMERLVHQQCSNYLSANNISSEAHSGFIDILDNIYWGIGGDEGARVGGVVFLDVAKACDMGKTTTLVSLWHYQMVLFTFRWTGSADCCGGSFVDPKTSEVWGAIEIKCRPPTFHLLHKRRPLTVNHYSVEEKAQKHPEIVLLYDVDLASP